MFANSDKFRAAVVYYNKNINENYTLKVSNIEIESKTFVKLLAIAIDNKLLFGKHFAFLSNRYTQYVDYKTKWV